MLHRGGFRIPLGNRGADPREKRQGAQQYVLQTFLENLMNSEKKFVRIRQRLVRRLHSAESATNTTVVGLLLTSCTKFLI